MPDMAASDTNVDEGGYDQQQEGHDRRQHPQQRQGPRYDRNNPPPPPSQPPPGAASRVKFTSDTKADRSHLIPQREKDGGDGRDFLDGGRPGGPPDVGREYGEDDGYRDDGYYDDDGRGGYRGGGPDGYRDEYGDEYHDGRGGYRDGRA